MNWIKQLLTKKKLYHARLNNPPKPGDLIYTIKNLKYVKVLTIDYNPNNKDVTYSYKKKQYTRHLYHFTKLVPE